MYPREEDSGDDSDGEGMVSGESSDLEAPLLLGHNGSTSSNLGKKTSPRAKNGQGSFGSGLLPTGAGSSSSIGNLEGQPSPGYAMPKPVKIKGTSATHHHQQQVRGCPQ